MMFSDVHNASKDISKIYKKVWSVPRFLSYPIWFMILIIVAISNKYVRTRLNNEQEN